MFIVKYGLNTKEFEIVENAFEFAFSKLDSSVYKTFSNDPEDMYCILEVHNCCVQMCDDDYKCLLPKTIIDNIIEKCDNDSKFRGTQIIAYLLGALGDKSVPADSRLKLEKLTKYIREINIYDSLGD